MSSLRPDREYESPNRQSWGFQFADIVSGRPTHALATGMSAQHVV